MYKASFLMSILAVLLLLTPALAQDSLALEDTPQQRSIVINPPGGGGSGGGGYGHLLSSVDVWLDRNSSSYGYGYTPTYRVGDYISVYIRPDANAYIYVFNARSDGTVDSLFPAGGHNGYVTRGNTLTLGGYSQGWRVSAPTGTDSLTVVASERLLTSDEVTSIKNTYGYGYYSGFTLRSIQIEPANTLRWAYDSVHFKISAY